MRPMFNNQIPLFSNPGSLTATKEYYSTYEKIAQVLDSNQEIIRHVHQDILKHHDGKENRRERRQGPGPLFSAETIIKVLLCQHIENLSLRKTVIRIDDSAYLRRFAGLDTGPMMDFSTLCLFKNAIQPETWRRINEILMKHGKDKGVVTGTELRQDTTAVETNIHYPTDSNLLWDVYRVLARFIDRIRPLDPEAVGSKRLQEAKAKKAMLWITRNAGKKKTLSKRVKKAYLKLIRLVEALLNWMETVIAAVADGIKNHRYTWDGELALKGLMADVKKYRDIGPKVVDQARRRVVHGELVPNEKKIFSIFEEHTELLVRGKAGKPIEFGHMVSIAQDRSKFITEYDVYRRRPVDYELVEPTLKKHQSFFGTYPDLYAGDKGFYESMEKIHELEEKVDTVSICKKGKRTKEETARESDSKFKLGQKFRAGAEGTISVLKRALGMARCLNKGWKHFVATVGSIIFAYNLRVLASEYG